MRDHRAARGDELRNLGVRVDVLDEAPSAAPAQGSEVPLLVGAASEDGVTARVDVAGCTVRRTERVMARPDLLPLGR